MTINAFNCIILHNTAYLWLHLLHINNRNIIIYDDWKVETLSMRLMKLQESKGARFSRWQALVAAIMRNIVQFDVVL